MSSSNEQHAETEYRRWTTAELHDNAECDFDDRKGARWSPLDTTRYDTRWWCKWEADKMTYVPAHKLARRKLRRIA